MSDHNKLKSKHRGWRYTDHDQIVCLIGNDRLLSWLLPCCDGLCSAIHTTASMEVSSNINCTFLVRSESFLHLLQPWPNASLLKGTPMLPLHLTSLLSCWQQCPLVSTLILLWQVPCMLYWLSIPGAVCSHVVQSVRTVHSDAHPDIPPSISTSTCVSFTFYHLLIPSPFAGLEHLANTHPSSPLSISDMVQS